MLHNPKTYIAATFPDETMSHPSSLRQQLSVMKKTGFSSYTQSVASPLAVAPVTVKKKVTKKLCSCLARVWREIHGLHDWEGLAEPLDPLLRQEIIRYGEFVKACYKVFDLDPTSKHYLNIKYGKKSMLKEVGLGDSGYEVTKYIYATPDINLPIQNGGSCSRWIGFVAVSSDEEVKRLGRRDVAVTFRGTITNPEWVANFMSSLTPARFDPQNPRPEVKVVSGFLSLYTSNESECKFGLGSCREQLLAEVSRILNKYESEEVSITLAGHSMGSSLALLLAYDIAELGLNINSNNNNNNNSNNGNSKEEKIPVTVLSYGGPRVGNSRFKERFEELGVKVLRIVNVNDPITKLPGVVFNEDFFRVLGGGERRNNDFMLFPGWSSSCYAHVGVELALDFLNMRNPSCAHDLEVYLNLLKSPNTTLQQQQQQTHPQMECLINLLNQAKQLLLTTQNLNVMVFLWSDAAIAIMSFLQSQ